MSRGIPRLELACLLAAAILLGYQTLFPPVIGMADNGDFQRVMTRFGMSAQVAAPEDRYFLYVNRVFALDPKVHWSVTDLFRGFLSTENYLLAAALCFNTLLSKYPGFFDIRMLGAIHVVLFFSGLALGLLALSRRPKPVRTAACAGALLIFCDGAYLAWFNSIYCEPGVLALFVLLLGTAVAIVERGVIETATLPAVLIASGLLLALEKNPYFVFGPLVLALVLRFGSLDVSRARRHVTIAAATLAALLAVLYLRHVPLDMEQAYKYDMLFQQLLRASTDPDADLKALGLDPSLKAYIGTYPYQPGVDIGLPYFEEKLYKRVGVSTVLHYYWMHPLRAVPLFAEGLNWGWVNRPLGLGNFEKPAGLAPRAQSTAWRLWSSAKAQAKPLGWMWSILLFLFTVVGNRVFHWRSRDRRTRLYCDLQLLLVATAVIEVGLVVFSQGMMDIDRKMFVYNLLVDAVLAINVCAVVGWVWGRLGSDNSVQIQAHASAR